MTAGAAETPWGWLELQIVAEPQNQSTEMAHVCKRGMECDLLKMWSVLYERGIPRSHHRHLPHWMGRMVVSQRHRGCMDPQWKVRTYQLFSRQHIWTCTQRGGAVERLCQAQVDLFANIDSTHCQAWFSLTVIWGKTHLTMTGLAANSMHSHLLHWFCPG